MFHIISQNTQNHKHEILRKFDVNAVVQDTDTIENDFRKTAIYVLDNLSE